MKLTPRLAAKIYQRTEMILQQKLAVTDLNGLVLSGVNAGSVETHALEAIGSLKLVQSPSGWWSPLKYEGKVIGAVGLSILTENATEVMDLVQGLAEVMIHQSILSKRAVSKVKLQSDFLFETLHEDDLTPFEEVMREADMLQLEIDRPWSCYVVQFADLDGNLADDTKLAENAARLEEIIGKLQTKWEGQLLSAYRLPNTILILMPVTSNQSRLSVVNKELVGSAEALGKLFGALGNKHFSVGVGQYYPGFGGLKKSFQEAKLALEIGLKLQPKSNIIHIRDIGMFVGLSRLPQQRKAELAYQILQPVIDDEQLLKTINQFLKSNLSLTDAAKLLHVHRNTLIYRLEKIKKLAGFDPRNFNDALQIKLGLLYTAKT